MPSTHSLPRSGSLIRHFDRWGYFYAEGHDLVGHMSCDVMEWLEAHPEFNGRVWFDYGTGEDHVEVTELFFPEPDDDSEAPSILHHEAANVCA